MTERLDRIEQTIERTTANVEDLLGAIAVTDRQVRDLRGESGDAKQRFEVLRAEAKNDRDEYRALFNDAVAQIEKQQKGWQAKFDSQQKGWQDRFDSQQMTIEKLLLSLLDRKDTQERLQARVTRLEQPREAS